MNAGATGGIERIDGGTLGGRRAVAPIADAVEEHS
ncbi:hypothetical protein ABH922_001786 [Rhodococcus sp. 27YEA15]